MSIIMLLIYFVLGIVLYLLNSYLVKKYDITKIKSIIISLLFLFVLSGVFNYYVSFTSNIFIILIFYLIVDIVNTTYFLNDDFFHTNKIKYYLVLIFLGFIFNMYFINKIDNVFLDPEQIKLVVWILIFIYLYRIISNSKIYNLKFENNSYDKESIGLSYVKYKNKYKLNYEDKDLELIIYSLMIFNNRKRNYLLRSIDKILFNVNGRNKKISIMLLDSDKVISDEEAINIVYNKLCEIKKNNKKIVSILKKYDSDNYEEINNIVNMIKEYFN